MKLILSENKLIKVIHKYLKPLFIQSKFNWVNDIEINVSDTKKSGWKESYPVFEYLIFSKEDFVPTSYIAEMILNIQEIHNLIFINNKDVPTAFYTIKMVYPNGNIRDLPSTAIEIS
jgi:hypothetical protein